jgi:hypothetical protein
MIRWIKCGVIITPKIFGGVMTDDVVGGGHGAIIGIALEVLISLHNLSCSYSAFVSEFTIFPEL